MSTVVNVSDESTIQGKKAVLLFWAPWHEASVEGGQMDAVLSTLASTCAGDSVIFARVEAEAVPALSSKFNITVVPTFLLLSSSGQVYQKIEGTDDISRITQAVQILVSPEFIESSGAAGASAAGAAESPEDALTKRLDGLIRSSKVMLFMKGSPDAPRCGFSRQAVEMLNKDNVPFGSFDILTDDIVRQGLKKHSDWPTYPQLYVDGELIGGLDILKEMKEDGSLRGQFGIKDTEKAAPEGPKLEDKLKALINRHSNMVFMKGLPSAPRCGFSKQIIEILDGLNIVYDTFNILEDNEVRQGLKTYSDWPTYPQLYHDGELIGGLDICKELVESGELKDMLSSS